MLPLGCEPLPDDDVLRRLRCSHLSVPLLPVVVVGCAVEFLILLRGWVVLWEGAGVVIAILEDVGQEVVRRVISRYVRSCIYT